MSLILTSLIDTGALIFCALILLKYARLTSIHPGFIYLLYHFMFFTLRSYSVLAGAPTLFTHWPRAIPVKESELAWAGILADAALVAMTIAFVVCSQRDRRLAFGTEDDRLRPAKLLSRKVVLFVCVIAFPVGIFALLAFGYVPSAEGISIDVGEWASSSWVVVTQLWPVLVLLALIYCYGFRRIWIAPIAVLLGVMAIQGYNRFRVIIPMIFLLITWQTQTGHKWPKKWMVVSFVCLTLISFPMKELGKMIRAGESASDVREVGLERMADVLQGASGDQKALDMFASVMWLVDNSGRRFYGTMYYPLVTLPIPRQVWPGKPDLNAYWRAIDSPVRPMYSNGMVSTVLGEAYANFGIVGVVIVPFCLAYALGLIYFKAMRKPYFSVYRFAYVIIACSLVQVFRDGLFSLVVFPLVNLMPLTAIAVLSELWDRKRVQAAAHIPKAA